MKQLSTTFLMLVFLFFVGFSAIVANPVPVSLSNGEPSSDVIDTATTNELGKSEPPLSSQDSVAYAGNEDGTQGNTINQGNTLIAPENQGSEPSSTSAPIGVGDEGDQSNSPQVQSVTSNLNSDTRGQESSNTARNDIVNPDDPAGSQDLVALANQNVLDNNEASEGKGCVPAGDSESKIFKSREKSEPCDGQIAQITFPIEIVPQFLRPFIEIPKIPAIGDPGTRIPTESPQKKPYPKPTTPWPRPDSPIRTPVDQNTCGPADQGWLTMCCQGILKWAAPNGVSNVFSSIYPNLAITARNDVDACIDCTIPSSLIYHQPS